MSAERGSKFVPGLMLGTSTAGRPAAADSGAPRPLAPERLNSIDAYRGLVMFLMMAEVLHLSSLAEQFPDSAAWQIIGFHTQHVAWVGCSLHDLIQPSFSFLVGVALPFSLASRKARGHGFARMLGHAGFRALVLVFLGVFLRSIGHKQTNFTFEDTLSQIGLGYVFLFLLGCARPWAAYAALAVILAGYWGAFAAFPVPPPDFQYTKESVNVAAEFAQKHNFTGFLAHWNINSNLAWKFDTWFLNLFPRESPFVGNAGGYSTLSFIPTLGTMLLGLIAGRILLRKEGRARKLAWLLLGAAICLPSGWALNEYGLCPNVKKIWTPAWTLFSGGWCFLLMGSFSLLVDLFGLRWLVFPLTVIGMNSITIYCLVHRMDGFLLSALDTHLGPDFSLLAGEVYRPIVRGGALLLIYWLFLLWMYRRKFFVRI
jgi:predicted acyltransferase